MSCKTPFESFLKPCWNPSRSDRLLAATLILAVTFLAIHAYAQKPREPLSRRDVVALLRAGVAPARMQTLVRQYGVSFEVSEQIANQLRQAGATEELLTLLRELAPKVTAPTPPVPAGPVLVIDATPGESQVYVDDEPVGTTSAEGMLKLSRLPAGSHRIRLSASGYHDRTRNVQLLAGETIRLLLSLEAAKPETHAEAHPKVNAAPSMSLPGSARVWKSTTTGREYGVWMDKDRLHTEWVNLPPAVVQGGGYVRSESRRVGSKWVGTVRSYLPCETTEAKECTSNRCQLETKIEFDSLTADRITGRAQAIHKFDCKACRLIEAAWADFSWIPRDQKAAGNKQ